MKTIYKALANFQQEVPVILKDTSGYGYKYADKYLIVKRIKNGTAYYTHVRYVWETV